jgi:type 1 glutamine amidotransferase
MIGLGGWGGRQAGTHGYLLRLIDGKWQPTSPDEGLSGEHGEQREFAVIHDKPSHPILKGLPTEWLHSKDELYSALRGPAKNIEVLAHSYSLLTKENEPVLFLITYGEGKVFHIPLGHDATSLHCVGHQTALARGTEYVATGKVTIGIPDSFPTKEKSSVVAPDKVEW